MKKLKHTIALLLALLLTFSAVAAALAEAQTPASWVNYSIIGSVQADTPTDPADNFYLYANKDWLLHAPIKESSGKATVFGERDDQVFEEIVTLLEGEQALSHEGQLAQTLYRTYTNMDKRNELGLAPLLPYVQRIQAIDSMEALTAYLLDDDRLGNNMIDIMLDLDLKNSSAYALYISNSAFLLQDADEYRSMTSVGRRLQEACAVMIKAMLLRLDYDEVSAQALIDNAFALEAKLGEATMGRTAMYSPDYYSIIYNPRTVEELKAASPNFPLADTLKPFTDAGIDHFILCDLGWLEKLNELYTVENLEAFKAYLLVGTLHDACRLVDQEGLDIDQEAASIYVGTPVKYDLREKGYDICNDLLGMGVGHMYADAYVSDQMRQDVTGIIHEVVKVYRARLQNAAWLGEETREKAIEKLDKLTIHVAAPTDWSLYDYSALSLSDYEHGGNLIQQSIAIRRFNRDQMVAEVLRPVNREKWREDLTPQTINAFYNPSDNSINILAGILGGSFYDEEASFEQKLATIGVVIGHEITHAFDTNGSQFDADGNMNNWWTEADMAAFEELTGKVADYYGSIEMLPGLYQNGQLTVGEAVADLGALSCMLEMAKEQPNFDYQAFFAAFAGVWATKHTREAEENNAKDPHPVSLLRTNCAVQQFEEFYAAFDVSEGDAMYLSPEKRLKVW